jgi:hypothetical protein
MKPLNLDNKPCSPISSNCVIWQGPDIPCIKLCTGDTVSDVVFKLATELCTIIDQLDVSNYDLSCFDLASCTPQTFQELLQFLIEQICAAQGITVPDGKIVECPDCVVSVAPCFVQGTQTTMQLVDYVQMIGNRLCSIVDEIASINSQITNINATLADLQFQIDNLPTYTLPEIPVDCILGPGNHPLDVILDALMNDNLLGYCALLSATGTPSEINTAVLSQCILDTDQPLAALPAVNTFSAYYAGSWVAAPALGASPTVANAINNAWIAICDIYNYLQASPTISVVDTNTINLTYTGGTLEANMQDTSWIPLLGFSYMSGASFKPFCRRIGNVIHFKGVIFVPLGTSNNGGGGNILPVVNPDDYNGVASGFTFNTLQASSGTDPDACLLSGPSYAPWAIGQEALRIQFARGNNIIPPGILGAGETLDGSASVTGRVICERVARSADLEDDITFTSVITLALSSTGILSVTSANFNDTFRGAGNCVGKTALTRQLCTTAIAGQYIPEYFGTAPSQFNAPAAGSYQPEIVGSTQTYGFNQDMSRAEQLGGLAINISGITAFVEDCSGSTPTFINC